MNIDFIMGIIIGIEFYSGYRTINEINKKSGIIQLGFAFSAPVFTFLWSLNKYSLSYDGTDFAFLFKTTFKDWIIEPCLIMALYLIAIILTVRNIIKIIKKENNIQNNNEI